MLGRVREEDRDGWFEIIEDWRRRTLVIFTEEKIVGRVREENNDYMKHKDAIQPPNMDTAVSMRGNSPSGIIPASFSLWNG